MRLPNLNLTFSAKRKLQRAGLIALILFMVMILLISCLSEKLRRRNSSCWRGRGKELGA